MQHFHTTIGSCCSSLCWYNIRRGLFKCRIDDNTKMIRYIWAGNAISCRCRHLLNKRRISFTNRYEKILNSAFLIRQHWSTVCKWKLEDELKCGCVKLKKSEETICYAIKELWSDETTCYTPPLTIDTWHLYIAIWSTSSWHANIPSFFSSHK